MTGRADTLTVTADREPVRRGSTAVLLWLAHPVTLLALLLLVVNDHVGKLAYPGVVTGKLSDVAGLVVAPPLLATVMVLLVPRLSGRAAALIGVAATGVGFTAVQLSAAVAQEASQVWSVVAGPSWLYADATDLIALPALAIGWWVWRRVARRPAPHRLVRLAQMVVIMPAAVLAVAATSVIYPYAVAATEWNGGLVAGWSNKYPEVDDQTPHWKLSGDAGNSWRHLDTAERERLAELPTEQTLRQRDCVPSDDVHCYRVVPGAMRVLESHDSGATWHTSWQVTDAQRQTLARHYPGVDDPARELSSVALVVHPTIDGHVVLVANGRDGFALRTTDGQWHRIGFPGGARAPHWDDPLHTTWAPYGVLWGIAAMLLALVLTLETVRRSGSRRWWRWWRWLPNVLSLLIIAAGLVWLIDLNPRQDPANGFEGFMWLVIGAATICFGLGLWLIEPLVNRALTASQWLVLAPGAVLVGALVAIPLVAAPATHPGAITAAVLLFGTATTILATATWRAAKQ